MLGRGRDRDTNSRTRGRVGEGMPKELDILKLGQFIINNDVITVILYFSLIHLTYFLDYLFPFFLFL